MVNDESSNVKTFRSIIIYVVGIKFIWGSYRQLHYSAPARAIRYKSGASPTHKPSACFSLLSCCHSAVVHASAIQ